MSFPWSRPFWSSRRQGKHAGTSCSSSRTAVLSLGSSSLIFLSDDSFPTVSTVLTESDGSSRLPGIPITWNPNYLEFHLPRIPSTWNSIYLESSPALCSTPGFPELRFSPVPSAVRSVLVKRRNSAGGTLQLQEPRPEVEADSGHAGMERRRAARLRGCTAGGERF